MTSFSHRHTGKSVRFANPMVGWCSASEASLDCRLHFSKSDDGLWPKQMAESKTHINVKLVATTAAGSAAAGPNGRILAIAVPKGKTFREIRAFITK